MSNHFHECVYCGKACECSLSEQEECLGCGRDECPGNEDESYMEEEA